ncbi:hypothetical protein GCM10008942_00940 [Rhizomicrobium electricum]|uniref:Uncharacterized protein n=1 Tax=Rhizomicrobium electricum TaxID=480070 RepID=A0ABP3NY85_9PROT
MQPREDHFGNGFLAALAFAARFEIQRIGKAAVLLEQLLHHGLFDQRSGTHLFGRDRHDGLYGNNGLGDLRLNLGDDGRRRFELFRVRTIRSGRPDSRAYSCEHDGQRTDEDAIGPA